MKTKLAENNDIIEVEHRKPLNAVTVEEALKITGKIRQLIRAACTKFIEKQKQRIS